MQPVLNLASQSPAPVLLFAYGNPSRGDDGLGPACAEWLQGQQQRLQCDIITDYQLQVEHALDLQHRSLVVFIDASVVAVAPYAFLPVAAARDNSYTSHAMSPAALLSVYQQVCNPAPPDTRLLSIRGYSFTLGQALSADAADNLQLACEFLIHLLEQRTVASENPADAMPQMPR